MTAIDSYQKLEVSGLWRAGAEAQRREVIVALGEASLILRDTSDRVLTHWSLAALDKGYTDEALAIYSPAGDPSETLEFSDDAREMIDAIDRIRADVTARKPNPGRLRRLITTLIALFLICISVIWLPQTIVQYTARVLPDTQRMQLGAALLVDVTALAGPLCEDTTGREALQRFSKRLLGAPNKLVVLESLDRDTAHLPGGLIAIGHGVLTAWDAPEVAAGFILAEAERAANQDATLNLLNDIGALGAIRLLIGGTLRPEDRTSYAKTLVQTQPDAVDSAALAMRFQATDMSARAYALATNQAELLQDDPFPGGRKPVLSDSDWVRLQGLCNP
ncbi:MAG: hypothetical protein P8Q92_09910 [Pseudoprimorskyibacter sp.]|nr:hypothetical protein [Pseudoprimorskyibacter sp.]